MNKYIRYFGMIAILCFSFYCAEQTALFMQKKDPLYESIAAVSDDYNVTSVDAIIDNDYIIPGLVGLKVNKEKSFQNMKYEGAFQTSKLIFEEIKPMISIDQNLDKIINQGNVSKQAISLIVQDDNLIHYLEEMNIPYAVLVTEENVTTHYAYGTKINYDFKNYDTVEKKLKANKENNELCFITEKHEDFCKQKKKRLIEETYILTKNNFASLYNKVASGNIIYLQNNLGISNLKLLLSKIYFKGLNIISLNDMISESRL